MSSSGGTDKKHGQGWGQQDWEQGYCVPTAYGGNRTSGPIEVAPALLAQPGSGYKGDFESETFIANVFTGDGETADPITASEGRTYTQEGNTFRLHNCAQTFKASHFTRGKDGAPSDIAPPLSADADRGDQDTLVFSIMPMNSGKDYKARQVDVAQPLMAAGPVGGNQGGDFIVQPAAYAVRTANTSANGHGIAEEVAHTLDQAQGQAVAFDTTQITHPENRSNPQPGDPCHPLAAGAHPPAVAFQPRIARNGRGDMGDLVNALQAQSGQTGKGDAAPCVATAMQVRRLTPIECCRLQGFPDDYLTQVPWRGKCPPPDGPMYKALGNSWAVPVVAWIGERIREVS